MSAPLLPIASKHKLEALGFQCAPCPPKSKQCKIPDWPQKTFSDQDFAADSNIAVKLLGFIDIDLDCAEANALAQYILPPSDCVWGRVSRPRAHWLYAGYLPKSKSFAHTGMVLEVRSGNHLTLGPGSVHPSGELVQFAAEGPPSSVNMSELLFCCRVLAASVPVWREAWGDGNHHAPALAFSGVLARANVPFEVAKNAIYGLAKLDPSTESLSDLLNCVETTYKQHAEGKAISGLKALIDAGLSEPAAKLIQEWLPAESAKDSLLRHDSPPDWKSLMTTVGEFAKRPFPAREPLIENVLLKCDAAILYGLPGEGKTLLSLAMANALARGGGVGPFKVSCKRKVGFIEGEMSGSDLAGQFKKMQISDDVRLIASADMQTCTPDISDPTQQAAIIEVLEREHIEVVWFDNLFSLAQIAEFVSNDDPGINGLARFAAELRNRGITVIFVHHATKTGHGPMGATRLLAPMDLVMKVERNENLLTLTFEKHRSRPQPPTMKLKIVDMDGLLYLQENTFAAGLAEKASEETALTMFNSGADSVNKLMGKLGWSKDKACKVLHSLTAKGDLARKSAAANAGYLLTEQGKARVAGISKGMSP